MGENHCSMKPELIGTRKKVNSKLWGYSRESDCNAAVNCWGGMTGKENSTLVHVRGSVRNE